MHPYSIDINDRVKIYPAILILALVSGYGLNVCVLGKFEWYKNISWFYDAPSSIAFIGFYYVAFDKWLWAIFSNCKLGIRTPVLKGTYTGFLLSSRDGKQNPVSATIIIKQTWSHIIIHLQTDTSTSDSEMAAIRSEVATGCRLQYQYINKDIFIADPSMQIHRGLTILEYNPDKKELKGTYFTDWHRGYHGEITVRRK